MKRIGDKKLIYSSEGELFDEDGYAIMMKWEKPIMKDTAKIICENGGQILNVGFGLGLIDNEIQKHNVNKHWIIESHPDVYKKMLEDGWHLKKNVKILFGDWRFFLPYLPEFDGIFFDTTGCDNSNKFFINVSNILKSDGIFSYFNTSKNKEVTLHSLKSTIGFPFNNFKYDFKVAHIDSIPDKQHKNNDNYWPPTQKQYYIPILKLKK